MNKTKNNTAKSNRTKVSPSTKTESKPEVSSFIKEQGIVVGAHNVLLPDGSRDKIMKCGDPITGKYRRKSSDDRWIYGDIVETDQGIVFNDSTNQPNLSDLPNNPVVEFLNAKSNIKEILANDSLAVDLVSALSHVIWTNGELFACMSDIDAGNSIALLRDKGEYYSDFAPDIRTSIDAEGVGKLLSGCGWYPANESDLLKISAHLHDIVEGGEVSEDDPITQLDINLKFSVE